MKHGKKSTALKAREPVKAFIAAHKGRRFVLD